MRKRGLLREAEEERRRKADDEQRRAEAEAKRRVAEDERRRKEETEARDKVEAEQREVKRRAMEEERQRVDREAAVTREAEERNRRAAASAEGGRGHPHRDAITMYENQNEERIEAIHKRAREEAAAKLEAQKNSVASSAAAEVVRPRAAVAPDRRGQEGDSKKKYPPWQLALTVVVGITVIIGGFVLFGVIADKYTAYRASLDSGSWAYFLLGWVPLLVIWGLYLLFKKK